MGREPKWAARWQDAEQTTVRVIYLTSSYRDAGRSAWVCSMPTPWWTESCDGHNGDSEAIALDLKYHDASGHWVLHAAHYRQHETRTTFRNPRATQGPHSTQTHVWMSTRRHDTRRWALRTSEAGTPIPPPRTARRALTRRTFTAVRVAQNATGPRRRFVVGYLKPSAGWNRGCTRRFSQYRASRPTSHQ